MRKLLVALILGFACTVASSASENTCEVVVTTGAFDPAAHALTYWTDGTTLTKIDGMNISGSDGDIPSREVRSIELRVGSSRYKAPLAATRDLFEPFYSDKDCTSGCRVICDATSPVLAMSGGDGAGAYTAIFLFNPKARYVRRFVSEHPEPDQAAGKIFDLLPLP
jgi:hypothetical protein